MASAPRRAYTKQPPAGAPPEAERGAEYYAGLLRTDVRETFGSSSEDMLKRNMQLAGGVAGLLGALLLGFMAANGLLPGQ